MPTLRSAIPQGRKALLCRQKCRVFLPLMNRGDYMLTHEVTPCGPVLTVTIVQNSTTSLWSTTSLPRSARSVCRMDRHSRRSLVRWRCHHGSWQRSQGGKTGDVAAFDPKMNALHCGEHPFLCLRHRGIELHTVEVTGGTTPRATDTVGKSLKNRAENLAER